MIKANVTIDEYGFIQSYETNQIDETELYVEVNSLDEIIIDKSIFSRYNELDSKGIIRNTGPTKEVFLKLKEKNSLREEKQQHLDWLADNDYRVNKYILGEYQDDDPAWVQYKADRATKIARINEIEGLLA